MQQLDQLPIHPVPESVQAGALAAVLRIEGLVETPVALSTSDLANLPRSPLSGDFSCAEGWSVADLQWEGIRLSEVLALARPLPEARYVRVCADEYAVPVALDQVDGALLCDRLAGEPLPLAHGAPWRLLLPNAGCFTSVKWVAQLELCAEPGENTALEIARAGRARARRAEVTFDRP